MFALTRNYVAQGRGAVANIVGTTIPSHPKNSGPSEPILPSSAFFDGLCEGPCRRV